MKRPNSFITEAQHQLYPHIQCHPLSKGGCIPVAIVIRIIHDVSYSTYRTHIYTCLGIGRQRAGLMNSMYCSTPSYILDIPPSLGASPLSLAVRIPKTCLLTSADSDPRADLAHVEAFAWLFSRPNNNHPGTAEQGQRAQRAAPVFESKVQTASIGPGAKQGSAARRGKGKKARRPHRRVRPALQLV